MLGPSRTKYRYRMKGRIAGKTTKGASLEFGEFGLKAIEGGLISSVQLEAARKTITHTSKRSGKLWIRVFPDKPITSKGAGVRMGGGKGDFKGYSAVVRPGKIIFELSGIPEEVALEAFRKAGQKLPVRSKIVKAR